MTVSEASAPDRWDPEPRWPAAVAVIAVAVLNFSLPHDLRFGPRWLFPGVIIALVLPTLIAHRRRKHNTDRVLGLAVTGLVTLVMILSLAQLVAALPSHLESPTELLISAASVWVTNVLVFALWYWRLDAGGPHARDLRFGHPDGAFLFPQMMLSPDNEARAGNGSWTPNFVDYLFLAFNTSTAFSPTDAPVLARWAKLLMMVQSVVSLSVLVLLAARAVNIL
jgi:hypothetical protein